MTSASIVRRGIGWPAAARAPKRKPETFPASPSEARFQAQVMELAMIHGWMVHHQRISIQSAPGWPDLVMLKTDRDGIGHLILAELKSERGNLRAEQKAWLNALNTVPCLMVRVWRPSDMVDIVKTLQAVA